MGSCSHSIHWSALHWTAGPVLRGDQDGVQCRARQVALAARPHTRRLGSCCDALDRPRPAALHPYSRSPAPVVPRRHPGGRRARLAPPARAPVAESGDTVNEGGEGVENWAACKVTFLKPGLIPP